MSHDRHSKRLPDQRGDKDSQSGAPAKSPLERRKAPRYTVNLHLQYLILSSTERVTETGMGQTIDVSSSGVRFKSQAPIAPGRHVRLLVDWPILLDGSAKLQLVVEGTVVRSNETETALRVVRHVFKTRRPDIKSA
jgi:hypothetical protein